MVECGLSYASVNVKIVGGVVAAPYSWPAAAYILFKYKADNVYVADYNTYTSVSTSSFCGGLSLHGCKSCSRRVKLKLIHL